ncbi:MAG TPA: slipin family protein [Pirellulales bacterium]|nr:slipin family protein [Pirellulales bacterium]
MTAREIIIKDTHRALYYEDGRLTKILEAGRYKLPARLAVALRLRPRVEIALVDIRERELTIKGQEILTSDKVAIRVSVVVQFKVIQPEAALHRVASFEDRLYSDVQLAARRSLASMTLEEILTNRNRLSEDILRDVKESAGSYGVAILRADVKDLIFPGNLQEIMNRVLAAQRMSEAQLVEARTKAETYRMDVAARSEAQRLTAEADAAARRLTAQSEAEAARLKAEADVAALAERAKAAAAYSEHPALLKLHEFETLRELAKNANARIYIGFDRDLERDGQE